MSKKAACIQKVRCINSEDSGLMKLDPDSQGDNNDVRPYKLQPTLIQDQIYSVIEMDEEFVRLKELPLDYWCRGRFEFIECSKSSHTK